ncbi:protein tyrosine phosphatase [Orenia metallireducens]|uniref:Protein tyrosine phosphatase n=1 Tax=Orenia metallireducens TaxID=1413210 RepID=A0A1C0A9D6_9FIRM|nr:arsenate reductase ArsC [Orenia metallireducens]OCL26875.1 protein tyrosine phosphatase [Orenia metallireducens]
MNKTKVLFLCTGNSARSQMAEAFLREYAGEKFEVYSGGLDAKGINPYTKKVMDEIGIDINKQESTPLKDYLGQKHFGYLITVCAAAEENCPTFPGVTKRLHWAFEDPVAFEGNEEEKLNKFREIRDKIKEKIKTWLVEKN